MIPTTREEAGVWLRNLQDIHDSLDVSRIEEVYSKNATLQFGNQLPVHGIDAVKAHFAGGYGFTASMKHDLRHYDIVENRIWHTAVLTFRVKNDPLDEDVVYVAAAFATFVTEGEEAGKISSYEIYPDFKPLMDKLETLSKAGTEN